MYKYLKWCRFLNLSSFYFCIFFCFVLFLFCIAFLKPKKSKLKILTCLSSNLNGIFFSKWSQTFGPYCILSGTKSMFFKHAINPYELTAIMWNTFFEIESWVVLFFISAALKLVHKGETLKPFKFISQVIFNLSWILDVDVMHLCSFCGWTCIWLYPYLDLVCGVVLPLILLGD